jgi:hypothetical protein
MSASRILGLMIVSSSLAVGCSSAKKIQPGATCILNTDCNNPLVCSMDKCHDACHATADCLVGQNCVKTDKGTVCQLPAEATCAQTMVCSGTLVCASDLRCRAGCLSAADCADKQVCVTGVCADTTELNTSGQLPPLAPDGGAKVAVGGTCILNGDCQQSLVCNQGKCHDACHTSADCPSGQSCVNTGSGAICQLPVEADCSRTSCGGAFVCASDLRCRIGCQSPTDCTSGQVCVGGVCADPIELDANGQLPQKGADGGTDARAVDASAKDGTAAGEVYGTGGRDGGSGLGGETGSSGGAGGATGSSNGGGSGLGGSAGGAAAGTGGTATPDASSPDLPVDRPADTAPATLLDGGASTVPTGCGKVTTQRYFCDDFESGLDQWHHASDGWDLTTTTSQSATHSVADSPNGNYPKGTKSEITMVSSADLTGAVSPILTFWSKRSIGFSSCGCTGVCITDSIFVDASSDGGNTWTLLTSYNCTNNTSVWSFQQLSLASYAGKRTKLRFRLDGPAGGADGFYLDDVEIRETDLPSAGVPDGGALNPVSAEPTGCEGAPVAERYFCEDFEAGLSSWLVATDGWNTVVSTSQSPTHSVADSPNGNYPAGAKSDMTMVSSVDLTSAVSPILTFWSKRSIGFASCGCTGVCVTDNTYVDASSDGGNTWTVLTYFNCTNNTSVWSFQQLSLASYAGKKTKLRFRLDGPSGGDGWYVDDIKIRENEFVPVPRDLALCTSQAAGGACNGADLCGKTCGPDLVGSKSLTCTASKFVESACTFPASADYSCYKVGAATACAAGTKAGQACTATACQACGATTGTGYLDTNGAIKQGFCVCSKGIWSCGTTAEWPCYPNPLVTGATVPASCN